MHQAIAVSGSDDNILFLRGKSSYHKRGAWVEIGPMSAETSSEFFTYHPGPWPTPGPKLLKVL